MDGSPQITYGFRIMETYVQVVVVIQLPAVFEPDNFWPGLAPRHAYEDDFVTEDVFVVKVGRLGHIGPLLNLAGDVHKIRFWSDLLRLDGTSLMAHWGFQFTVFEF